MHISDLLRNMCYQTDVSINHTYTDSSVIFHFLRCHLNPLSFHHTDFQGLLVSRMITNFPAVSQHWHILPWSHCAIQNTTNKHCHYDFAELLYMGNLHRDADTDFGEETEQSWSPCTSQNRQEPAEPHIKKKGRSRKTNTDKKN